MGETDSGKAQHSLTDTKHDISNLWAWALFYCVTTVFGSNGSFRICDILGISGKSF